MLMEIWTYISFALAIGTGLFVFYFLVKKDDSREKEEARASTSMRTAIGRTRPEAVPPTGIEPVLQP